MMQNRIQTTLLLTAGFFMAVALSPGAAFADDPPESDTLATWHFENPSEEISPTREPGFWYPERAFFDVVDTLSFSGRNSIAVSYDPAALGGAQEDNFRMSFDNVHNIGIKPQQTLHVRVFVPEESADKISQVIVYDMWNRAEQGGTGFHYVPTIYNVPSDDVTPGEWVTLTHLIDRDVTKETLSRIGVRVDIDTEYTGEPPMVFVDFITTDPDAQPLDTPSDPDPDPDPDPEFTRAQIIHNSADPAAEVVDIYANGGLLVDSLAFRAATPFVDVPGDTPLLIEIYPHGADASATDAVFTLDGVEFPEGGTFTVIANGLIGGGFADNPDGIGTGFNLYVLESSESHGDGDESSFFVWHGATDAPGVDVFARDVAQLADDLRYLDDTGYITVPAADYTVDIAPAGGDVIASFTAPLSGLGGQALGVLASGFLDPSANNGGEAFGLLAVLADGTTLMLPAADLPDPDPEPVFDTHVTWHFETPSDVISPTREAGFWYPDRAFLEAVDTLSYSGLNSIAVSYDPASLGGAQEDNFRMSFDNVHNIGIVPQHTLHFRVFVPEEAAEKITRIDLYDMWNRAEQGGSGFHMARTNYDMDDIIPGEWVTLTHRIDRDVTKETLSRIGILVMIDTEYSGEPPMIFVDFISTDPDAALQARLSPPRNVTGTNVTAATVDLVWDPPTGTDEVAEYVIYQGGRTDFNFEDKVEIGRTADTTFSVTGLSEKSYYFFRVTAVTAGGLVTGPSEVALIQTVTFDNHVTWHFETPSDVISPERATGFWYPDRAFLEAVDTLSYSGLNSIAVSYDPASLGGAQEDNFRMSFDNVHNIGIVPQHTLHFRVFVPEEAAEKITRIDLYDMWNRAERGGSGFHMVRTNYDMDDIIPGEWVTLTHLINRDVTKETLSRIGILVMIDTEYTGEPPMIFVDFISTDKGAALQPRLSPPRNVTGINITVTSVDLVWDPPTGTDEVAEYVIYQGGRTDIHFEDKEEIGRTADTTFSVTGLNEKTYYFFRVTAITTGDLVTGPSEIALIQTVTGSDDLEDIPLVFKLKANYPNPFNPSTNIVYQIPVETEVTLRVYNTMGQLVSTLVDNVQQQPGEYTVTFDASGVASGMYLYRIEAGEFRQTKQMMLIK